MTTRDRIVLIGIVTLALLAAIWFMAVSPEREKASKLDAQVSAANGQLATAEGELANARQAQGRYSAAYASIVSLGKAVPPEQEVPSLVYQLDQASNHKRVDFSSIVAGGGSGASASSSAASTSASSAPAAGGFTQMPFTFIFNGSFVDLYHLFQQLNQFTEHAQSGELRVSGRLLTIQALRLAPTVGNGSGQTSALTGTITATAYVLPASQGLTAGATAAAPAGLSSQAGSGSSPALPAIAKVTP
jgi:Tfp pilus assembly protein PilO